VPHAHPPTPLYEGGTVKGRMVNRLDFWSSQVSCIWKAPREGLSVPAEPVRGDETYVKVKGRWMYLYRAVDSRGQTIDFLLSAKRDAEAAKRVFRKALAQPHTVNPRTITADKNAAYPKATMEMKKDGELWRRSRLRQVKYLNNIVEQDHRRVKRLTGPGLGFGGFWTARRTLAGYEAMAMIRKGQVQNIGGSDIRAQAQFIAGLFQVAA
jgi:transposase, IS6 family